MGLFKNSLIPKKTFFHGNKPRPIAVLAIREAGVGDFLSQVERFLWLGEYFNFESKFFISDQKPGRDRNGFSLTEIFKLLGFSDSAYLCDYFQKWKAMPLSQIRHMNMKSKKPIFFRYDMASYGNNELSECIKSVNNQNLPHPAIKRLLRNSYLNKKIEIKRKMRNKSKKIVIHVRRGDVAQVPITFLEPILKGGVDKSLILHCSGVFTKDMIKSEIPQGNYNRFKSIAAHLKQVNKVIKNAGDQYEISLLSDGMTKLSTRIRGRNSDLLLKPDYSQWQIQRCLEQELFPLIEISSSCIIGEGKDTFVPCIVEALSSDCVISASPGFLRRINRYLGYNIEYVDV